METSIVTSRSAKECEPIKKRDIQGRKPTSDMLPDLIQLTVKALIFLQVWSDNFNSLKTLVVASGNLPCGGLMAAVMSSAGDVGGV